MKKLLLIGLALLLSFVTVVPGTSVTAEEKMELSLYAINVGKADALLLRSGETAYLIDTGSEDSWPALKKALQAEGITRLDGVILTHTHKDHAGGLAYLLDSDIEVDQIYASGYFKKKEKKHPAVIAAKEKDRTVTFLYGGDTLPLDGGTLEVLGPLEEAEEENNNSLVLLAAGGGGTMLLAGDMEFPEEESLLKAGKIPQVDVLKVGNHGNPDATGKDFLQAVSPKVAVFSTDSDVEPDTPAKRIVNWLSAHGVQMVVTQESEGGVMVKLQAGEISVEKK